MQGSWLCVCLCFRLIDQDAWTITDSHNLNNYSLLLNITVVCWIMALFWHLELCCGYILLFLGWCFSLFFFSFVFLGGGGFAQCKKYITSRWDSVKGSHSFSALIVCVYMKWFCFCSDLWDRLMEGRIKLQKTLSLINKIPSGVQLEGSEVQQGELWGDAFLFVCVFTCTHIRILMFVIASLWWKHYGGMTWHVCVCTCFHGCVLMWFRWCISWSASYL